MKIFVAYGYNDRDRWVRDLVFPIIEAFGDEVVTGEDLQGDQITDGVRRAIEQSHAMVAFATRRDQLDPQRWTTHRWVTDEISCAITCRKPIVEVREQGVDGQGGIAGDRQRIAYSENERERCLVEIVKAIGRWHQSCNVKLQLLPNECVEGIRTFLKHPNLRCTYRMLYDDGSESQDMAATILPITGGLFLHARDVPRMSLIRVQVECSGKSWTSSYENIDSVGIHLHQD